MDGQDSDRRDRAGAGFGRLHAGAAAAPQPGTVTREAILGARTDGANWLTTGRTYDEQRHSPLAQINRQNVAQLGLDWFADLDTSRGQEATPIVIDGTIYVSTAWSMVKAYDGRTGKLLWSYDPHVPRERLASACCDAVNRGVAAWNDSLFVGTLDGRLVSLDRHTGREQWSVVTVDQSQALHDHRRAAGDRRPGDHRQWRRRIWRARLRHRLRRRRRARSSGASTPSPAIPANGFEGDYLRRAADTWHGEWWRLGGGGTVWDSMAYDPELNLLYIGVGNGSPWNQLYRSEGQGDNLYLSSIVAIRPDTGQYVWHYQETPGESWDFTATQHIILADLTIDGHPRKVLMQAPKNGFFYVIDRTNGQLISARNFVQVNWATGIDMRTGRPIENPEARFYRTGRPFISIPGAAGRAQLAPDVLRSAIGPGLHPVPGCGLPLYVAGQLAAGGAGLQQRARHGRGGDAGDRRGPRGGAAGDARRLDRLGSRAPARGLARPVSRARGMAACSRPRAGWCSKARRPAISPPSIPRTAAACGPSRRRPAWSRRRSPTRSAASNMSR